MTHSQHAFRIKTDQAATDSRVTNITYSVWKPTCLLGVALIVHYRSKTQQ